MIYTVTLNPAIDYVLNVRQFEAGRINRSENEATFFGGKGINVSLVLRELGMESVALGFVSGFTGKAIEQGIDEMGVKTDFVHAKTGFTRINVKIRSGQETDVNGNGPEIDGEEVEQLFGKLDKLTDGDTLVLAGSIPKSLSSDIYERVLSKLQGRRIRFVVDASKSLLVNSLKYSPFLIKPNTDELGEIFAVKINGRKDAVLYAHKLQQMGAKNVLVSMGGEGAVLLDEHGAEHFAPAIKGKVVNTVGAGDSMVAGFVAGYLKTDDYDYALKLGTAAGSATAFSVGLATKDDIDKLLGGMQ